MKIELKIQAEWDTEAEVWFVSSSEVPGLNAEAPTPEALVEKITAMVPDLMELNQHLIDNGNDVPINLLMQRQEHLNIAVA